jgi:hypothetical protein
VFDFESTAGTDTGMVALCAGGSLQREGEIVVTVRRKQQCLSRYIRNKFYRELYVISRSTSSQTVSDTWQFR